MANETAPELGELLGETIGKAFQDVNKSSADFEKMQAESYSEIKGAQAEMMASFKKGLAKVTGGFLLPGQQQQLPPEVDVIAKTLVAQPQLIPLVDSYLKGIVARLNAAGMAILEEEMRRNQPPPS